MVDLFDFYHGMSAKSVFAQGRRYHHARYICGNWPLPGRVRGGPGRHWVGAQQLVQDLRLRDGFNDFWIYFPVHLVQNDWKWRATLLCLKNYQGKKGRAWKTWCTIFLKATVAGLRVKLMKLTATSFPGNLQIALAMESQLLRPINGVIIPINSQKYMGFTGVNSPYTCIGAATPDIIVFRPTLWSYVHGICFAGVNSPYLLELFQPPQFLQVTNRAHRP